MERNICKRYEAPTAEAVEEVSFSTTLVPKDDSEIKFVYLVPENCIRALFSVSDDLLGENPNYLDDEPTAYWFYHDWGENMGSGWRAPTYSDFVYLFNSTDKYGYALLFQSDNLTGDAAMVCWRGNSVRLVRDLD